MGFILNTGYFSEDVWNLLDLTFWSFGDSLGLEIERWGFRCIVDSGRKLGMGRIVRECV